MGEEQALSCEWRKRSPNGLTPVLSGLGVPRAKPLSQSATVIRFLAERYGPQPAMPMAHHQVSFRLLTQMICS